MHCASVLTLRACAQNECLPTVCMLTAHLDLILSHHIILMLLINDQIMKKSEDADISCPQLRQREAQHSFCPSHTVKTAGSQTLSRAFMAPSRGFCFASLLCSPRTIIYTLRLLPNAKDVRRHRVSLLHSHKDTRENLTPVVLSGSIRRQACKLAAKSQQRHCPISWAAAGAVISSTAAILPASAAPLPDTAAEGWCHG